MKPPKLYRVVYLYDEDFGDLRYRLALDDDNEKCWCHLDWRDYKEYFIPPMDHMDYWDTTYEWSSTPIGKAEYEARRHNPRYSRNRKTIKEQKPPPRVQTGDFDFDADIPF